MHQTLDLARTCDGCGRQECADFDLCDVTHQPAIGPRRSTDEEWAIEWEAEHGTPLSALRERLDVSEAVAVWNEATHTWGDFGLLSRRRNQERPGRAAAVSLLRLGLTARQAAAVCDTTPEEFVAELTDHNRNAKVEGVIDVFDILVEGEFKSFGEVGRRCGVSRQQVCRLVELVTAP